MRQDPVTRMSPAAAGSARHPGRLERHGRWLAVILFLVALALRLHAVSSFPAVPCSDAADYHRLAAGIVAGRGYVESGGARTAWRPPGYPVFLAGIYAVCGPRPYAAYLAQAALGAITVALVMLLGRLLLGGREALASGLLAALYPGFCWLPRVLLSENLALPLLVGALCATAMLIQTDQWGWAAALGVLLGLGLLVRGAIFLVAILLLAGLLGTAAGRRSQRQSVALASVALGGMLLVLLPWGVRNYLLFGRIVPVATQDGMALYASYWPPHAGSKRIWGNLPGAEDPAVAAAARARDEAAVSDQLRTVTIRRLREQPGYFFRLIPAKLISLAAPFDWEWFPHRAGSSRSVNLGYVIMLPPALLGVWVLRRRSVPDQWLLWVLPMAVILQSVIFYGSPRFRLPAETTAILLASAGTAWMHRLAREYSRSLGMRIPRGHSLRHLLGAAPRRQH
jgi:4-amino-4-deoxy-L-arabinose transferase-like glycosyltransferase